MSKFNFFERITVTSSDFADHEMNFDFISAGFAIVNESTIDGNTVEYSFNKSTLHGDLITGGIDGIIYDSRHENKIWFRLKAGSSAC